MSKNLGIMVDENGNEFYPKSANDVLTLNNINNGNVYSDVYCFHRYTTSAGVLGIRLGKMKVEHNLMYAVKLTFMYYQYSTELMIQFYSWKAATYFHTPTFTTSNSHAINRVRLGVDSDGYIWILIGEEVATYFYVTCSIDKVLLGFDVSNLSVRDDITTGWTFNTFADLSGFTRLAECVKLADYKMLDSVKRAKSAPIGEFILWEGNFHGVENGTYQYFGTYYNPKSHLLYVYPEKEGYRRTYKLRLEYSTGNIASTGHLHIGFNNYSGGGLKYEVLFNNIWGATSDGTRSSSIKDFDMETAIGDGLHINLTVSPTYGSGADFRLYRLTILVYDELLIYE